MASLAAEVAVAPPSPPTAPANATAAHQLLLSECQRYAALAELRKGFGRLWKSTWGHAAPAEAFNAWLIEALSCCEESPWLPLPGGLQEGDSGNVPSRAIETWVLLQVPCEWPNADDVATGKLYFDRYVAAAKEAPQPELWDGLSEAIVDEAIWSIGTDTYTDPSALRAATLQALRPLVAEALLTMLP